MGDNDIPQVRNRDDRHRQGHNFVRIEMLRARCLIGRSFRRRWRFAAAHLIHRSAPRTIRAAAHRRGTCGRGRHAHAEREQEGDEDYRKQAHAYTLLLPSGAGNDAHLDRRPTLTWLRQIPLDGRHHIAP